MLVSDAAALKAADGFKFNQVSQALRLHATDLTVRDTDHIKDFHYHRRENHQTWTK
jgi:hypothetical protein